MPGLNENLVAELVGRRIVTDTFRRLPAEKKLHIYEAALRLFGRYGYDGLAVDRICRECAISKGSFFQYFPSKTHLLEFTLVLFDDALRQWLADVRLRETAVLARDRLLYLCTEVLINSKLHRSQQVFFLFATRALHHSGVTIEGIELTRHFRDYISEIVRRGEQTGEIRGDFDVDLTAYLVAIVLDGMTARGFLEPSSIRAPLSDYFISFLFDGIKSGV
jgi:AcrR family transcriptional regulator